MAELSALIFDVDGTLADTERDGHRVAFNEAFHEAGLGWIWSEELYGDLLAVGGGKERIRYYLERFNTAYSPPGDVGDFIAELHRRKTTCYTKLLDKGQIPLRTGVLRLLREARKEGIRLAIATTSHPDNVIALLNQPAHREISDWFEVIAAGDMVASKKPAPDVYMLAMDKLGVPPESCLAFEDSENGVQSVRASGIDSLIVAVNDYTRKQDFDGATLVTDHLGDPGRPCRVLAGEPQDVQMIDLRLLRRLHGMSGKAALGARP